MVLPVDIWSYGYCVCVKGFQRYIYTRYQFRTRCRRNYTGGAGYAIETVNGKEIYHKEMDNPLNGSVDHLMPDYSIYEQYGIRDTAYGFLTKGCPRGCSFCHVKNMQGTSVIDFSPLREFWNGQKYIKLLDPNITASPKCVQYFEQLADTKSFVDFTQGIDIRLMTDSKWNALNHIKVKNVHFAWDNPNDDMIPRFEDGLRHIEFKRQKHTVYILTNFNSTFEQDVYRVETVKRFGLQPYVMIYNKPNAPKNIKRLARYANNPWVCWRLNSFSEYT